MKKLILTLAAAATCVLTVNAQQRTILYQEFTGENCGPCAAENPGLESLMAANPTKIIHVTNMEPVPSSGFFYTSQQTLNDACMGYYNPTWTSFGGYEFTPFGFMDGFLPDSSTGTSSIPCGNCGSVGQLTQSDINKESAIPSPITISASHYFNAAHDSVYGKVVIKSTAAMGGHQLKLRAAFVKTMNFSSPPGDNGETHFENVNRAMYPTQAGQSIASVWAAGSTNIYTYAGKIAGLEGSMTGITVVDSNFVVWVQNDSANKTNLYVLQAAKSVYSPGFASLGVSGVTTPSMSLNIYPNPATESATLSFNLEQVSDVQVKVLDELGRTFNTISQKLEAGVQKIELSTNELPAGVYLVQLQVNDAIITQRLVVTR